MQQQEYSFKSSSKKYTVFIAKDNHVELYNEEKPSKDGMYFSSLKELFFFVNNLTDTLEGINENGNN